MSHNTGLKRGFIMGVFCCLLVLTLIFLTKTIYAGSQQDKQPRNDEVNGVTMGVVPLSYGMLKSVVGDPSTGVYFLWFEDARGTLRVVGVSRGVVSERVTDIKRD